MYFADIIGQRDLKESLTRAVKANQVAHAHLFAGVDGGGHLPLALAFAGYLFCTNRGETDRCGTCTACKQMDHLAHPDLHFSFPFVKKEKVKTSESLRRDFVGKLLDQPYMTLHDWEDEIDAMNKRVLIPVSESQDIIRRLSLQSFMDGYRVMVIWMAEKLNAEASNALLKTLEEPGSRTVIILVTSHAEAILPTIVSRTQITRCHRLSEGTIARALIEREGVSAEVAKNAARFGDGGYRRALEMTAGGGLKTETYFPLLRDWLRACVAKNLGAAIKISGDLAKFQRDEQQRFLEYALGFIHESVKYSVLGAAKSNFEGPAAEFAVKFAPYILEKDLGGFHDALNRAHYLVSRNAYPPLLFLKTSYEMMKLFSKSREGKAA